jgi:parallel beta-helix repeat protein
MNALKKRASVCLFFIAALVSTFFMTGTMHFTQAYSDSQYINGTISSDTVWTREYRYIINGSLTVAKGVTLTIEPGVFIQSSWNFQIEGTLVARGTAADPIHYSGSSITFAPSSSGWNEQTGSGCVIENFEWSAGRIVVMESSPKINQNFIERGTISVKGGSPIIANNIIGSPVSPISIQKGAPLIFNNTIYNSNIKEVTESGGTLISSNEARGIELTGPNSAVITQNTLQYLDVGILINAGTPVIQSNFIASDYNSGIGVSVTGNANPTIENNTVTLNYAGLNFYDNPGSLIILNNNIYGNNRYNVLMGQEGVYGSTAESIDASYNWWGTTDKTVIDQKIYDYTDDSNLGKVNYTPILTAANPQAMPDPNAPIPTPAQTTNPSNSPTPTDASQNPTATLSQPVSGDSDLFGLDLIDIAMLVLLGVIVVLLVFVVIYLRKRSLK